METIPVVGADLGIYTCHNKAYDNAGKVGTVANNRFKDMWFSDKTKRFFDNFNAKISCQHECSNDGKNKLINSLVDASVDNFV